MIWWWWFNWFGECGSGKSAQSARLLISTFGAVQRKIWNQEITFQFQISCFTYHQFYFIKDKIKPSLFSLSNFVQQLQSFTDTCKKLFQAFPIYSLGLCIESTLFLEALLFFYSVSLYTPSLWYAFLMYFIFYARQILVNIWKINVRTTGFSTECYKELTALLNHKNSSQTRSFSAIFAIIVV